MTEEKLELQFERAELDGPPAPAEPAAPAARARPVACASCGALVRSYWSVNGATACRRCHDAAVAHHQGSHLPTLAKALGLGAVGALLGAILYFAVAKITGYEIGLVAIVVGLLVGKAVKMGAGGRGGWPYQALAVALCYLSIATSYGAFAISELASQGEERAAQAQAQAEAEAEAAPGAPATPSDPGAAEAATPGGAEPAGDAEEELSGLALTADLLLLLVKLPVLIGFESPMTFLLVAIALWEAWKLNVEVPLQATGPFAVGDGAVHG